MRAAAEALARPGRRAAGRPGDRRGLHRLARRDAGLMEAVARLPQGAVVLPGFDFDLPDSVWERLGADEAGRGSSAAPLPGAAVRSACDRRSGAGLDTRRRRRFRSATRLVSLALRPPPVTDQWLTEGPALAGTWPPPAPA